MKKLGYETVAEGVETEEQYEYLKKIDCDNIQGFLLGKPMPEEELADVLEVLDAISCSQGSDLTEVTRIKEEKKATKGGFSKRIYLHKTITK